MIAWANVRLSFSRCSRKLTCLGQMGDANASIPTVQPIIGRPMWGSYPKVAALNSVLFVSELSISSGTIATYGLKKKAVPVKNCRNIGKKDMKNNNYKPRITVDPETYRVSSRHAARLSIWR